MRPNSEVTILGVDASLRTTGVGLVALRGTALAAIHFEVFRNPAHMPRGECLQRLYSRIGELLGEYSPQAVAVESVFFCRNVKTAIALGEALGVVLAAAAREGIPLYEYSPREIKRALVGTGAAHKRQIAFMVQRVLNLPEAPAPDAADALAVAVCHAHRVRNDAAGRK